MENLIVRDHIQMIPVRISIAKKINYPQCCLIVVFIFQIKHPYRLANDPTILHGK